jgi:hypothetical protein
MGVESLVISDKPAWLKAIFPAKTQKCNRDNSSYHD